MNILPAGIKYYSRINNITRGNEILHAGTKYYSRERILLAGTKYNSRGPNITRGDHILLAETKYYSREWNITRGNVLITRGTEELLAGTKYYSLEYNITRGNELLLAGKNITRGKELLLAEIYLLLAGTIYYSRERNIGSIWHQRASVHMYVVRRINYRANWLGKFVSAIWIGKGVTSYIDGYPLPDLCVFSAVSLTGFDWSTLLSPALRVRSRLLHGPPPRCLGRGTAWLSQRNLSRFERMKVQDKCVYSLYCIC